MVKKDIKLRKIKKTDSRYFLKWWKDKDLIKLTSGIYEKSDKILKGYFFDMLKSKDNHHYLILLDNKPIGNVSISKINNSTFEIHIIIGDKKYWGKGFGVTAIQKALKIAFDRLGYKKAYLEVRPDNSRAIRAYQNCGFEELGLKKYPQNKYQPVVLKMSLSKNKFENNKYLKFGKYTKDCPESFLNKIKKVDKGKSKKEYIKIVLSAISEEFNSKKYNTTYTNIFNKSRFISVKNILKKRQRSCGSRATIVASVLRNLNIPTKLIDGLYIKDNSKMRHAWNEVYINKKWVPFDITKKDFKIGKYHIRKNEWIDWGDLEKNIKERDN